MTQEDKNLLLKDLSSRIPYNVKVQTHDGDTVQLYSIGNCEMDDTKIRLFINGGYYPNIVKPYLRPMSSMTKEEEDEYQGCGNKDIAESGEFLVPTHRIDFLNSHYLDYRGLIERGLALEAPEWMYNSTNNA